MIMRVALLLRFAVSCNEGVKELRQNAAELDRAEALRSSPFSSSMLTMMPAGQAALKPILEGSRRSMLSNYAPLFPQKP
jgi:hypothetical protein